RGKYPSRADGEYAAVVQRHHNPGAIGNVVGRLHDFADFLRVNTDRFARGKAPKDEIDVVRCFHSRGRKLDAAANFLSEIARNVPAHQRTDGLANGAVIYRTLHISKFRIEALRIPDGK